MKVKLTEDSQGKGSDGKDVELPKGTIIEHPEAFLLCQFGNAEPADEEATKAYEALKAECAARAARGAKRKKAKTGLGVPAQK